MTKKVVKVQLSIITGCLFITSKDGLNVKFQANEVPNAVKHMMQGNLTAYFNAEVSETPYMVKLIDRITTYGGEYGQYQQPISGNG